MTEPAGTATVAVAELVVVVAEGVTVVDATVVVVVVTVAVGGAEVVKKYLPSTAEAGMAV